MYQSEFTYLEFLDHIMTECEDAIKVEYGCQLPKCKHGGKVMSLKELRVHLNDECNKITMICNICGETFRRPWAQYHECVRVYRKRLDIKDEEIEAINREVTQRDYMISALEEEKAAEEMAREQRYRAH